MLMKAQINMFYRQMAAMTASGMSTAEAIGALAEEEDNSKMGKLLWLMNKDISAGKSAGQVLIENLDHLTNVPAHLFNEEREKIAPLFDRIADYGEKREEIKSYAWTIMIYPISLIIIATVICNGMLLFVIPIFQKMFEDMGGHLPIPTQIIIELSSFAQEYWALLPLVVALAIVFFSRNMSLLYRIADKIPFLGKVNRQVAAADFLANLSLVHSFSMSAGETCRIAAGNVRNKYFADRFKTIAERVPDYEALIHEMGGERLFPNAIIKTLKVGDRTGSLNIALERTADFCERNAEKASRVFSAAMVPAIIITLGFILGFFVIAMYLPIFSIAGGI